MTKTSIAALMLSAVGVATAKGATVSNPWSGVAGDRANYSAFIFKATAGEFPTSVSPLGAIDGGPIFTLNSLTFTRPANDIATSIPAVNTNPGGLSSLTADVYIDVYSSRIGISGLDFTGFLGSSTNAFAWQDIGGSDLIAPGSTYTYNFSGLTLDKDTEYWMVFSETSGDGDVANFRTRVNTSASTAGTGYLASDIQLVTPGTTPTNRDWAVEYVADVTSVIPEPSSVILALITLGLATRLRRRQC
jgi:hypothetical protein